MLVASKNERCVWELRWEDRSQDWACELEVVFKGVSTLLGDETLKVSLKRTPNSILVIEYPGGKQHFREIARPDWVGTLRRCTHTQPYVRFVKRPTQSGLAISRKCCFPRGRVPAGDISLVQPLVQKSQHHPMHRTVTRRDFSDKLLYKKTPSGPLHRTASRPMHRVLYTGEIYRTNACTKTQHMMLCTAPHRILCIGCCNQARSPDKALLGRWVAASDHMHRVYTGEISRSNACTKTQHQILCTAPCYDSDHIHRVL